MERGGDMNKHKGLLSTLGGFSLLVLLMVGITAALLTDVEENEYLFEIEGETVDIDLEVTGLSGESTAVVSGQTFEIVPVITNLGTANVYTFLEIDVPMVGETPVFTYTADESAWELVSTETADEYQKSVYSYGSLTVLDSGLDTADNPLIETGTFGNIRSETDLQLPLIVKAYAATDAGFAGSPDELEPADVWTTTLSAVEG